MMPSTMMILSIFIGVSFFLMIVFFFFYKFMGKKDDHFVNANKDQAVLRVYGDKIKINGRKIKEYDSIKGESLEDMVALAPGKYVISGKYKTSDVGLAGNKTYETPGVVELEVELKRGEIYTMGLFFEHPGEIEADGTMEVVASSAFRASGLLAKHKEFFVLCYRNGVIDRGAVLTDDRLKKIAVSGLYSMQQNASVDTLLTGLGKARKKTILEDWWGIYNGDDAVETLERLVFYMKTTSCLFKERTPDLISRVLINEKLLSEDIHSMEELQGNSTWKRYIKILKKERVISDEAEVLVCTPLAWDMGRLVFIARLCCDAGLIDEQKAWEYIDAAYENLRHFDSWHSFANSYMIGRTMWDVENPFISDFRNFEKELLKPGKLWNLAPI